MTARADIPKIVWCYWRQGWDAAPRVVVASLNSWRRFNPGWRVHALDEASLRTFLPTDAMQRINDSNASNEALSDQIRIELLERYGGVWADATTLCMRSLDEWLPDHTQSGFFAFSKPGKDRMIASWFLAAEKGSVIVMRWRNAVHDYWSEPPQKIDYFWFHHLFGQIYERDAQVRALWDAVPALTARHPGHFGADADGLVDRMTTAQRAMLDDPPSPVFKLSRKLHRKADPESILEELCRREEAHAVAPRGDVGRTLLLTWYGSFEGHGTIGDLRALEAAATHLVGRGHRVSHASAAHISIPGATRIDWQQASPSMFDAVVFVCGPILKGHRETSALFEKFKNRSFAGISVSLMPPGHPNFINPFEYVLARQGDANVWGDLAVVAPHACANHRRDQKRKIGIALRGSQGEYGAERCLWRETELLASKLAREAATQLNGTEIVTIENHLARSGVTADEIEQAYAECALVITSRFHGAISALRNDVPFIAIDQIAGGEKVRALLGPLAWPHTYAIDSLVEDELVAASKRLVLEPPHEALMVAKNTAIREANRTLRALDSWLTELE